MTKLVGFALLSIVLGVLVNLVSNYLAPTADRHRRLILSLLLAIAALSVLVTLLPDSTDAAIVDILHRVLDTRPDDPLFSVYAVAFLVVCFLLFRLLRHILLPLLSAIEPLTTLEVTYLESLIHDLEGRNDANRWSDAFYVPVASDLQPKLHSYDLPPSFYLVRTIHKGLHRQDFANLSNVEKIDSTRGTTFKSLSSALAKATDRTVVVIAPPGAGKTVSLRNLAINVARDRLARRANVVPIFVNLGHYRGLQGEAVPPKQSDSIPLKFETFLDESFGKSGYVSFLSDGHWETMLKQNRCMFFLDGLDELPRKPEEYLKRTKIIESFTRSWPKTRFILSCRELDYEQELTFQQILLKPFDRSRIKSFLSKYLSGQPSKTKYDEILANQPIFELCRNPFYLNLIAYFVRHTGTVPRNKAELFNHLIDSVIEREATRLSLDDVESFKGSFTAALTQLAAYLAFFKQETIVNLDTYLSSLDSTLDRPHHEEMLKYAKSCGLIEIAEDRSIVRFSHNRFQEYFSSFFISSRFRDDPSVLPPGFFTNLWWRETALFVSFIDPHPEDFVRLISDRSRIYTHARPHIQRLVHLDMLILAFECTFSSLTFADQSLRSDLRVRLLRYYAHIASSNSLERAKILTALASDDSTTSRACIQGALSDRSDWVSERAFFILCDGELRFQMRPKQVLKEFWRFFISGRIISTLPAVVRASKQSRLLRIFLPAYFILMAMNAGSIFAVGYVLVAYARFVLFDMQLAFTVECLLCLALIAGETLLIVYTLSNDLRPVLTRFIFAAPMAMSFLYVTLVVSPIVVRAVGIIIGVGLMVLYTRTVGERHTAPLTDSLTIPMMVVAITSLVYSLAIDGEWRQRITFAETILRQRAFSRESGVLGASEGIVTVFIVILLTGIILGIVWLILREGDGLRRFVQARSRIRRAFGSSEYGDGTLNDVADTLSDVRAYDWAQKILVEDVIRSARTDAMLSREAVVVMLNQLADRLRESTAKDAVFQKLEGEERGLRREMTV